MAELISSRGNPLVGHFKKLAASRAYREESGEFPGDGRKLLQEAVRWGAEVKTVLYTGDVPPEVPGARLVQVTESVMQAASRMDTPQDVLFSCRLPKQGLPDPLPAQFVVLDGVQDPGNVGTILRTADAMDCDVLVLPGCADLFSPKTVRAAMGVHFRRALRRCSLEELSARTKAEHIPLYATALREDTVDLRKVALNRAAVVIGSEGRGISPEVMACCTAALKIPMSPRCESLNAAAAATIVLWEMARAAGHIE